MPWFGLLRLEPKCHMWHASFAVYDFNLRPPCWKCLVFSALHPRVSISMPLYTSLFQLHGEHGETIAWMAGRPPPWCHSFAATAKPNRFGEGRGSKIKAWHQVIETIPYTSGKKIRSSHTLCWKRNHPVPLPGVAGKWCHFTFTEAFSRTDSQARGYKVWNSY